MITMCSGSVVVTAYDFESGRLGSNLVSGQYTMRHRLFSAQSFTAQGSPEPSSLRGITSVPEQLNMKAATGACTLIDGMQPRTVFGHSSSDIIWYMPQK